MYIVHTIHTLTIQIHSSMYIVLTIHTHNSMYTVLILHTHSNMYIVLTIHTLNIMYIVLTIQIHNRVYIVLTLHSRSIMYIVLTLQTYSSMYIVLTVIADLASLISFLGAHQISSQYLENISELGFFIYNLTKSTSFNIFWKFQRTWMWNVVFYNILNFQMCSSKNKVVVVFLKRPTFFGLKYYWSQNLQLVWEFV